MKDKLKKDFKKLLDDAKYGDIELKFYVHMVAYLGKDRKSLVLKKIKFN